MPRRSFDFLLSQPFQSNVAEQMFVYRPGRTSRSAAWQGLVLQPSNPGYAAAADIDANRERWISQWRSLVQG